MNRTKRIEAYMADDSLAPLANIRVTSEVPEFHRATMRTVIACLGFGLALAVALAVAS